MAIYQRKFTYRDISNENFGLVVTAFESDNGEVDIYLDIEYVFTDKYNGTKRNDYGAKYSNVALLSITMVKKNYTEFSLYELRNAMEWLTSLHKVSWLDLYNDNDEIMYSFLGRFTDVKLQKMDARVIGIRAEFTAVSPWAYSNIHSMKTSVNGNLKCPLFNCSDESAVYIYPKVVFKNNAEDGEFRIKNIATGKETVVSNLKKNEIVTMDSNQIIYSDNDIKVFGDDFNFEWLALIPGANYVLITGTGELIVEYRDIMKVTDAIYDFEGNKSETTLKASLLLTEIYMPADKWIKVDKEENKYVQTVTINHTTPTSKIDLQPNEEQIYSLDDTSTTLQIGNNNGTFIAYATRWVPEGAEQKAPEIDYTMQATIEETTEEIEKRIYTVSLYKDAWEEEPFGYKQYIYIKDLTENSIVFIEPVPELLEELDDVWATLFVINNTDGVCVYSTAYVPKKDYMIMLSVAETKHVDNF